MNLFDDYKMMSDMEEGENVIPIFTDIIKKTDEIKEYPEILPILPLRNSVLFPGVVFPINIGRQKSFKLIREIQRTTRIFGALSQIDAEVEDPQFSDMHKIGTVAEILKVIEMPDNTISVIIQGKSRFEVLEYTGSEPYFMARVRYLKEPVEPKNDHDMDAILSSIKDIAIKIVRMSQNAPGELSFALKNIDNATFLVNYIATNCNCTNDEKQTLLEANELKQRAIGLLRYLNEQKQFLDLKNEIQGKVKKDMDKQQREYFLNQQIKTIQEELGGSPYEKEIDELREKGKKKKWSKEIAEVYEAEIKKLEQLNPMSAEFSVQMNYMHVFVDLPWNEYTKDNFNLKHAQKVLDRDHFGLDEVKDRILEHLAVLKLKGDLKSPILCLYGPPGVGKTSLGKSIADALGRKYVRMSLGGLHDESEIRGHRRTYIGAMPGRILQNINKAKSSNPVFILDEIDKVGNDYRGDPSSALLEVLDPEQNTEFHDNFIDQEYDLSKVMFIATANNISTINPALRDRMEMIEISGYVTEEKLEIAKRHLIPKEFDNHGIKKYKIKVDDSAILKIIEDYTRESGVRSLDKQIAKLARRLAKAIGMDEEYPKVITAENLETFIGKPLFHRDMYEEQEFAGVVTGLAWTAVGGEILYIETSLSAGDGKMTLTGNLGDVMKESAKLAMEYVKAHADKLGIKPEVFDKWNIHLHVPEGAIPKDGPSAGITMATAIASAFTQRKVKSHIAMTGEITLRGKVLPVGGIKEKILAAKRAGITEIILSRENEKDINDIKPIYLEGVQFHYVDTVSDVFELAITDKKVKNAKKLTDK
ncbi:MAG: endopeptidase La [Bacteroidales bacterium]|nr:endopeptidase La [Bacteroidales bacterium]MBQ2077115.1 endopeptidase La [Bacteroidales bacterium]MBQ2542763.1 endopeptidase La [Bacteroidales bacterium]MBQ5457440.1 endopeptidase La [Bacteroidales bacterium]MBQ6275223.1 endopeptidase La [Bacteroidales bacterium]